MGQYKRDGRILWFFFFGVYYKRNGSEYIREVTV